jgi:hypothetical protein
MLRDPIANIVDVLHSHGFDPRRVGVEAWEARCPLHRSTDHALAITRNEHNHVVLECRGTEKCDQLRIVRTLGLSMDHVYAETPDWLISRLRSFPIQRASFGSPDARAANEVVNSSIPEIRTEESESLFERRIQAVSEAIVPPQDLPPTGGPAAEAGILALLNEPAPAQSVACAGPPSERTPAAALGFPVSVFSSRRDSVHNPERQSSVQILSWLASSATLLRSADGRFCARVPVGNRLEIYGLKSAGFRDWLIDGFLTRQSEPPSSWAVSRVVAMLEARARFSAGVPEVFVRVGQEVAPGDSPYFLDLCDPSGQAVAIRDSGWHVVDRPGVQFRRPGGLLPMPLPAHDGSIDLLRPYVNLAEPDFRLMIAWLTAALRPVGPYPILVLNGEQASGKSTLARILRLLIDPQATPVLALPKSTHDLMATALNGWLLIYENISTISNWLSDALCQLVFGGGFASRALFTNDELSVIYAQRPVILVGIDDFVVRADLRDRSVFMNLAAIPHSRRRTERGFWPAFRADYPRILGGVLDAIVGGLHALPSVELKELPRMADFAEWGEATSRGLGWGTETFGATYNTNRKDATEALLEDSEVAEVVLAMGKIGVNWAASPQVVYERITRGLDREARPKWPKSPSMFGAELRRIAPQLRLHGISVDFRRRNGKRIVTLKTDGTTAERPLADCEPS